METESWNGHTNGHIKAPWERGDVLSYRNSYSIEFHGFQTPWNSSQCSMNSMDFDALHCSYQSLSYSVSRGVDDSRQLLYFSGPLSSTNPYFADPDLKYSTYVYDSFYRPPPHLRDPIPPPWEDNTYHVINTHDVTNPSVHSNYTDGCNGYSFNNNSTDGCKGYSFNSNSSSIIMQSYLSEAKAKSTALYGNGVKIRDRRPSRSVSDKRMSLSEAPKQHFTRSLSFKSALDNQDTIPQYTKARSLVEKVIENLVKKMVYAQSRPNMVSDMIFNPSNLCKRSAPTDDSDDFSRKLMQRILLLQIRELGPKLMHLALNEAEFASQNWALNSQVRQDYPNPGLRLLCLQQRFTEVGMEAFDVLTKLRTQVPHMASEDGSHGTGILRIAVMAGNPGCSTLGSHLFFLKHCPLLEIQTDLVTGHVGWEGIVEAISVKGLGMVSLSFMEVINHPTCLRSYRIVFFMNALGENLQSQYEEQSAVGLQWEFFWNNLYQNTSAMVLVIIYETSLVWDEIKPRKGLWWFSGMPDEECVYIVRKV